MHAFSLLWSGQLLCLWNKFYNIYKLYEKLHIDVLSKRGQPKMQKLKYVSAAFGDGFSLKLLIVLLLTLSAVVCVTANSLQIDLTHLRYQRRWLITCVHCFVFIQPLALILRIAIIIIAVCRYDNKCHHFGLIKHLQPSLILAYPASSYSSSQYLWTSTWASLDFVFPP